MHNICGLTLIFIMSNLLLLIQGNPVGELPSMSMYDLLLEHSSSKCPYLKTSKLLEPKPSFLKKCSDYATLRSITELTRETQYDFLCLLYYNNLIFLCDTPLVKAIVINDTNIDAITKWYDLERTCRDLSQSKLLLEFKQAEGLLSNFKQADVCTLLCKELLVSGATPICRLSAATLNLTSSLRRINAKTLEAVKNPPRPEPAKESKKTLEVLHQEVEVPVKPQLVPHPAVPDIHDNSVKIETGNVPKAEEKSAPVQETKSTETQVKIAPEPVSKPDVSKPDSAKSGTNSVDDKSESQPGLGENPSVKEEKAPEKSEEVPVVKSGDASSKMQTDEAKQETKDDTIGGDKKSAEGAGSKSADTGVNDKVGSDQEPPPPVKSEEPEPPVGQRNKPEEGAIPIDDDDTQDNMSNDDDDMDEHFGKDSPKAIEIVKPNTKPQETDEDVMVPSYSNSNSDEEDSFFFIYFMMVCAVFILGYIGYHNKQKVLALVIEGRRGRRGSRRGRPNSANYHKLDSNLEEAVTSACNKNPTNIIY